jgi:hypothetical protein
MQKRQLFADADESSAIARADDAIAADNGGAADGDDDVMDEIMQSAGDMFGDEEDFDSTGHEPESAHSASRAQEKRDRVQRQTTAKA